MDKTNQEGDKMFYNGGNRLGFAVGDSGFQICRRLVVAETMGADGGDEGGGGTR